MPIRLSSNPLRIPLGALVRSVTPLRVAPLFVAVSVAVLTGTNTPAIAQNAPQQPVRGGEMVFALGSDLSTTNPALSTQIPDVMVGCGIYQGLVSVSNNFQIKPLLATSWAVSPDGLVYTFQLRKASWTDGQPFTSADVAYSLLDFNARYSPLFRASGAMIKSIDTPAPDKVVITLKQPFGPFLMSLSCVEGGAVMPKHIFQGTDARTNPASNDKPVGTGPMRLVSWKRGDSIELTRNDKYWDTPKPYLDRAIGRVMPQSTSRMQALQAGEIDYIQGWSLAPNDFANVRANKALKLETSGYASGTVYMEFNTARAPFKDVRVRKALAMATNRDYILRSAWFGDGVVSIGPFNSSIGWAVDPNTDFRKMYPYDVATANKLLDEAGYKRDANSIRFKARVTYPSDAPDRERVALALKAMWKEVGVDVLPESPERAVYANEVYTQHDFDVGLEFLNSFGEPAFGITRVYATEAIDRPYGNGSRYSNPQVDKLFATAQHVTAPADRAMYYRDAQKILAADLPSMPIREARMQDAASVKLHGMWGALGAADWENAWMSK